MIVFYALPNILSLPYATTQMAELRDEKNKQVFDEKGKLRLIEKIVPEYFKFLPGKNSISVELWLKIIEYNKEDWDYYSSILTVFKPKTVEVEKDSEDGSNEKVIEKVEVGTDEEEINLGDLSTREFKELIENTMEIEDIKKYLKHETNRDRPRPSVLKAIKSRKAQINKADEAVSKKE